jgi:hypothetical protein
MKNVDLIKQSLLPLLKLNKDNYNAYKNIFLIMLEKQIL